MRNFAVLFPILLILAGCGSDPPPAAPAAESPNYSSANFRAFVEEYFDSLFDFSPTLGSSNGLHQYDSKLEQMTAEAFRIRIDRLRELGNRLDDIRKQQLQPAELMDGTILANQIRAELMDLETLQTWKKNPINYVGLPGYTVDTLMKRDYAPKPERLRAMIARMRSIPAVVEAMRANVQAPPKEFTDIAVRLASGSIGFFKGSVADWAKGAAGGDQELLNDFQNANAAVVKSLEGTLAYLNKELLPKSNGTFAIGAANFARKLYYDEMVDLPLDRVLKIGEANLEKDYKAFVETAGKINMAQTPAQVMTSLSDKHPSESTLISSAEDVLEGIRKFVVDRKIATIPSEVRPILAHTPPYARSGSFASMDTPGAYETQAKEAYYYITPPEVDWTPKHKEEHLRQYARPVMDIISIHEAYPGHFVQFLYARQFPTKVRKLISVGSNVEGWAHYAEQMMVDLGYGGKNPEVRLAQLAEALVRDCRYVAGIKLHTQGMTVEQASKLFEQKAFMEPANAYEEARRGAYNPTYLYYTLGKLMIQKLRADCEKSKGASVFQLQDFHDQFLKQGGIPIPIIRQILLPGTREAPL